MEIEQMRIRMGEMAAEIERLNSELAGSLNCIENTMAIENDLRAENARLQSIIDEANAHSARQAIGFNDFISALYDAGWKDTADAQWDKSSKLHEKWFKPTQQSPAVAVPDYKEELFQLRQQAENWSTKLGFIASVIDSRKISLSAKEREFPHLLIERLHTDSELLKQRSGSPRITEQDARAIANDFWLWNQSNNSDNPVADWDDSYVLNKLNNPVVGG